MEDHKKIINHLLITHPFYATSLLSVKYELTEKTKRVDIDGITMRINPMFFSSLSDREKEYLLCHEILHVSLLHHTRRGGRDFEKWNEACDYVINLHLEESGFTLPKDVLINRDYRGLSAEQVFKIIKDKPSKKQNIGGDVKDFPGDKKEDIEKEERNVNSKNTLGTEFDESKTTELLKQIKGLLNSNIGWLNLLSQHLLDLSKDDYTWEKPNVNYLPFGVYLPRCENKTIHNITIALDTSGSTFSKNTLSKLLTEINEIKKQINCNVSIIQCDNIVRDFKIYEKDEDIPLDLEIKGGGGTSFRPPFEYIENHNNLDTKILIYLTDGVCDLFPKVEPDYKVFWVIENNTKKFINPFGEVLYV